MLRMHFSAGDIARTRVADGPDPFWEAVLSLHRVRERRAQPELTGWRGRVLRNAREPLSLLLPLVPARGYFPDFLTPAASADGFEAGLDALLSTPRRELHTQIGRLAADGAAPRGLARSVGEGRAPALRRLADALRDYRRIAFGRSWQRVRARTEDDRAWRARVQWCSGTEAMLRTFGPGIRWRAPVLEADYPVDKDIHLDGRGLLLIPSYFCSAKPVALADPSLAPTLVYPVSRNRPAPAAAPGTDPAGAHLARLLGHTRAAVLQTLAGDCTTSELAGRAGVSLSSASEHAAVLRAAGLVSSTRQRNTVRHSLTPMGLALLDGRTDPWS
ncbi:winged helix-turn-helix transcriptional regulator [Streptomyces sp. A7024]|uniref:Winged helix-turn-helix transcriptional regulator n=1 Tax=Streptomyces coryli TaxID=1128680 RepID=A0A6G4U274_9ACTN|nr:winged helix-turn-helix domain-containing protein [Streptomyces coryli]NGN65806.1 winged helix-turn-helix transcriptional regulator [Streptomyces coryli]